MAFARVANISAHENQTVPAHIARRLSRRDGEPDSVVYGITLDTNYHLVDESQ